MLNHVLVILGRNVMLGIISLIFRPHLIKILVFYFLCNV